LDFGSGQSSTRFSDFDVFSRALMAISEVGQLTYYLLA
jgi:hypothetical protein